MGDAENGKGVGEVAAELEQELARFEQRVDLARRLRLTSEKNLTRASQAVAEASESQERVVAQVRALIEALTRSGKRQEEQARSLQERAVEIAHRRDELSGLRQRFTALGEEAHEINVFLQAAPTAPEAGGPEEEKRGLVARLREAAERMEKVAEQATAIGQAAAEAELDDVARQAEGLQKQVLAARNKMLLTLQRLA
jgi:chromosome segregation ATPase